MQLQVKPHPDACLATAFAMVLNKRVDDLFARIGHDGTRVAAHAPNGRVLTVGHHPQECIEVCQSLGYAVTQIELAPTSQLSRSNVTIIPVTFSPNNEDRFLRHVHGTHKGVLAGLGQDLAHAVAIQDGVIFDPDGFCYPFGDALRPFYPRILWKVQKTL